MSTYQRNSSAFSVIQNELASGKSKWLKFDCMSQRISLFRCDRAKPKNANESSDLSQARERQGWLRLCLQLICCNRHQRAIVQQLWQEIKQLARTVEEIFEWAADWGHYGGEPRIPHRHTRVHLRRERSNLLHAECTACPTARQYARGVQHVRLQVGEGKWIGQLALWLLRHQQLQAVLKQNEKVSPGP